MAYISISSSMRKYMSHGLLINEPPLQVLPRLAQIIGLNEAIVLQQIHYWQNPRFNKNLINGKYWVYKTYEQWKEEFPFWSVRTIQRIIYNLENIKVIFSFVTDENFGNTKYYAINHDVLYEIMQKKSVLATSRQVDETPLVKLTRPPRQVDETPLVKLTSSYIDTETTTETTTERGENSESAEEPIGVFSKNAPPPKKETKKDKKGTRLSDDWELPVEWREWSIERGMMSREVDLSEVKFKNYWLSTTKNPTKINWFRTWQNWCLEECGRKGIRFNVKSSSLAEPNPTYGFVAAAANAIKKTSEDPKIQAWHDLQGDLSERIGENEYKSWMFDLELVEINDNAVFRAKSSFVKDYVSQRFIGEICACLGKIDSRLLSRDRVKFVIAINPLQRALRPY